MAWVVDPLVALYTSDRRPVADSGMVTLLARVSPRGKLDVELRGLEVGLVVSDT